MKLTYLCISFNHTLSSKVFLRCLLACCRSLGHPNVRIKQWIGSGTLLCRRDTFKIHFNTQNSLKQISTQVSS